MAKTFFSIKRGGHLSLGSLPGKSFQATLIAPPCLSLSAPKESLMSPPPVKNDIPYFEEKIKRLKLIIDCQKSSVALWAAEMPRYYLLPKVKDQLAINEKLLADLTRGQPCQ